MSQRTEVRVKKTSERRSLRFAGLEFAPPLTAEERAEAEQVLADATASGDYSKLPPPRDETIAVWADDDRHHYVLLGDEEGNPVAVRFKVGPVRDPRREDMAKGGFVPVKTLKAMQPKPKRRAPGAGGGAGGGGGGGGGADAPAPLTDKQQKRKSELLQRLEAGIKGLAQQGAGQLLGGLIKEGGSLGGAIGTLAGNAGQSLVGMGIGGLLSAGSDAFFSKVWGVDDSSSTGEQVAHHLAQELAGLMQAELQKQAMEGLLGKAFGVSNGPKDWREQFTGIAAPDGLPMVRMGDKTDHGGVVQSGEASVLVEGMPAARMTDTQLCPKIEPGPLPHVGGTIDQGDPLVVVGGHEAARHDHLSLCTGCGLLAKVVKGQTSVQIGTDSTAPPVANPKEAPKVGSGGSGGGSGVKGSGEASGSSGSAGGQASTSQGGLDAGSEQAPEGADGEPQSPDEIERRILELRKRMATEDLTEEEWHKLADEHNRLERLGNFPDDTDTDTDTDTDNQTPGRPQESPEAKPEPRDVTPGQSDKDEESPVSGGVKGGKDGPSLEVSYEEEGKTDVTIGGRKAGEASGTVGGGLEVGNGKVSANAGVGGKLKNRLGDEVSVSANGTVECKGLSCSVSGSLDANMVTHVGKAEIGTSVSLGTGTSEFDVNGKVDNKGDLTVSVKIPIGPKSSGGFSVKVPVKSLPNWIPDWIVPRIPQGPGHMDRNPMDLRNAL